jgi:uncharacterized membrane protein YgdD (TMEM256/DUF423 family)
VLISERLAEPFAEGTNSFLHGITFGGPKLLGMVAPLGGLSLMLAWLVFAVAVARLPRGVSSAN